MRHLVLLVLFLAVSAIASFCAETPAEIELRQKLDAQQVLLDKLAAEKPKPASSESGSHDSYAVYALLITTVFGFLTTMGNQFYQGWVASRDRTWQREDAAKANEAAIALANGHAAAIAEKLKGVEENVKNVGVSAQDAYREANTVNLKLQEIGVQMRDGHPLKPQDSDHA